MRRKNGLEWFSQSCERRLCAPQTRMLYPVTFSSEFPYPWDCTAAQAKKLMAVAESRAGAMAAMRAAEEEAARRAANDEAEQKAATVEVRPWGTNATPSTRESKRGWTIL